MRYGRSWGSKALGIRNSKVVVTPSGPSALLVTSATVQVVVGGYLLRRSGDPFTDLRPPLMRWAMLVLDNSRNRSRTWCSMEVCGARAKMRTYRSHRRVESHARAPATHRAVGPFRGQDRLRLRSNLLESRS